LLQNATSEEDAPMPTASLVRPALAVLALLSAAPAALAQPAPARENTAALMRQWAEDTAYAYLEAWSSSGRAAANDVRDIYGPRVSFYGASSTGAACTRRSAASPDAGPSAATSTAPAP
jgi:hypothetical protein